MGARRQRLDLRQQDQIESRKRNGVLKKKEQARRDARMVEWVEKGTLPYIPPVMSWLSAKLGKPSKRVTKEDIDGLLEEQKSTQGSPA